MQRVLRILLLVLTTLLCVTCAPKKQLSWEAVPVPGTKASFDSNRGVLVARKLRVTLEFTPLPYLKKIDDALYGGTIGVSNNARDYITVLWETVDLSDSFGFFKTYKFGQKKRLAVAFPKQDIAIPSGNERVFSFSLNRADYESARDLVEHATFTLILPIQHAGEPSTTVLEVMYTVRELK